MKNRNEQKINLIIWIKAVSITAGAIAAFFVLFPKLPDITSAPKPTAPIIQFMYSNGNEAQQELLDLNAVLSPILISLSDHLAIPEISGEKTTLLIPPLQTSNNKQLFPKWLRRNRFQTANSQDECFTQLYPSDNFPDIAFKRYNAFTNIPPDKTSSMEIQFKDSLQNYQLELAPLDYSRFNATDNYWNIEAYVSFDKSGIPRHVLLSFPSDNHKLNKAVVKQIYASRLKNPDKQCEGHIQFSFSPNSQYNINK
jgi:hypothetical protein